MARLEKIRTAVRRHPQGLRVATAVSAMVLGVAVRRGLKWGWSRGTGTAPPDNPADHGVRWEEALAWAAITGAAVGAARVVGRRWATAALR